MAEMTNLLLLNVPLEKDYQHTLYFTSAYNQHSYFYSRKKREYTDFSYQRKDNIIRVPDHVDNLIAAGCNYVMYKNPVYGDKWFYAFIIGMEYVNPSVTAVKIQTDALQTWMFEMQMKPSFVEREHARTDEIGDHTIDEGLATGEYTVNRRLYLNYGKELAVIVGVTKDPETKQQVYGLSYGGVYSGVKYYAFNSTSEGAISDFLHKYDNDAGADAIVCMFIAPKQILKFMNDSSITDGAAVSTFPQPHRLEINPYSNPESSGGDVLNYESVVEEFSTNNIDGYVPRNKKLMAYPYRCLTVSNNAGGAAIYRFERFYSEASNGTRTLLEPTFLIRSVVTPGCSIRLTPKYYNGATENQEEGLNLGKYPIVNWSSDVYTNWLTQNSVNIGIDIASGLFQAAAGAAMMFGSGGLAAGIGGGTIVGGVSAVAGTLTEMHKQSMVPPQARGNLNAGDVITSAGDNTFQFYVMSVKKEYAKVLDEYFDMYGYKCSRVKIPEKAHRAAYWYTKTIDANITGPIPQDDLQTIKDCYNRGVTFWRSPDSFRNYSVANGIV